MRTRKDAAAQKNASNVIDTPMIFRDLARECDELLVRAQSHYPHREGRGAIREDLFRTFLVKRLPTSVAIGKGHIQDSHGTTTSEFDVVLFDPLARLIIADCVDQRVVYPVEAVIAAIEIRTRIDKQALMDTHAKAEQLASLKRYYTPTSLAQEFYDDDSLKDLKEGLLGTECSKSHPGFTNIGLVLVGFDSLSEITLKDHLSTMANGVEMILALGKFVAVRSNREFEVNSLGLHSLAMLVMTLMHRIQHHRQSSSLFDWDFGRYFSVPEIENEGDSLTE